MTTPGGVPNLPAGGMTLDTLQSMLQDMTPPAMRGRAAQRIPGTYDGSTGGNPLNDLTPFGILTTLFAGFNSHVANADPADIQGPDDLPGLLLDFIESLPVVGQLVGLLEAILGTYDGDDAILLEIQKFFGLFRDLFGLIDLDLDDLPTVEEVWQLVVTNFIQPLLDLVGAIGDGLNAILSPIFNGIDFTDPPTPAEVWQTIATVFLAPLNIFAIPSDVQASINGALGDLQDALDGSYTGSGPIFLAVQALAEAWLKATDPLNAANLFGRISLPQFGSGVPIMALTTAVPNELEPFTATSVPTVDGWSFNAGQDAAQVVADGSTKTLYLQSGVIKVEAGQPLDTGVSVTYSGVSSSAGQSIRYVLETFTSDDGSGTATPVTVGSVSNPSGTITTPVLLGSSSWAIPVGVQSVRPALVQDLSAGTVFWKNTPTLKKKLAGPLSGGLPAAIQDRIDDFNGLLADLLSNPAGVLGPLPQTLVSGLTGALGDLQTTLNQIGAIFENEVVTPINSIVQAVKDWFNTWFGGGSTNAIPLSQKGAANGVAPLNGSTKVATSYLETNVANGVPKLTSGGKLDLTYVDTNGGNQLVKTDAFGFVPTANLPGLPYLPSSQKGAANGVAPLNNNTVVPLDYLPAEVGGSGGSGDGRPYVVIHLPVNQSITNNSETVVTGLSQFGSTSVTFEDSSNTRFRFNTPGMWLISGQIAYPQTTNGTGIREGSLRRYVTIGGSPFAAKLMISQFPPISGRMQAGMFTGMVRAVNFTYGVTTLAENDWFDLTTFQNSGGTAQLASSTGFTGTYITCIYLGA